MFDLIIQNALLIDGSGEPGKRLDLGVRGETIAAIDDLQAASAAEVIDAGGLVLAPGFIDIHSHADCTLPGLPTADSKVHQGVTSEVVGNCGISAAPLNDALRASGELETLLGNFGFDWPWNTFEEYLERLRHTGTSVNVIPLVGHGTVRARVMGMDSAEPSPEQLQSMQAEVRAALRAGAWGLSTGLIYPPNVYSSTAEVASLAQAAAREGGIYTSHIRGEAGTVLEAAEEAIEIGRRAEIPVEISHLKAELRANWHKMPQLVDMIQAARARGQEVYADMYPYNAFCTSLTALLPAWALAGGRQAAAARLQDAAQRAEILRCMQADALDGGEGYWGGTVLTFCTGHPELAGRSLDELAESLHTDPAAAALEVILMSRGDAGMVQFAMSEENVAFGLQQDFVAIGSDGDGRAVEGPFASGMPHPRNFGTFARVLGRYARRQGLFPLHTAVHKMTGMPAARLGLPRRGLLRPGYYADLVLFNPETVEDCATFAAPHQYAAGIEGVWVNGQAVVRRGAHTRALPGRVLTRS